MDAKRAKLNSSYEENEDDDDKTGIIGQIEEYQDKLEELQHKACQAIAKLEQQLSVDQIPIFNLRDDEVNKIPNFWYTAMLNHPELCSLINDVDDDHLHYLTKLEVQFPDSDMSLFKLIFHFKENPYFTNTVLTKEYIIGNKDRSLEGPNNNRKVIITSPVNWKDGHDISVQLKEKKQSLMYWLISNEYANDFDIAQVIKEEIYANPLPFYLLNDDVPENDERGEEDTEDEVILIEDSDEDREGKTEDKEEDSEPETEENGSITSCENEPEQT